MLLAIDPSMTMTGYAVLDGPRRIVEAGVFRPRGKGQVTRLASMMLDARSLFVVHDVQDVVVELPGTYHIAAKQGRRSAVNLPWYGVAVGSFLFGIMDHAHGVSVSQWAAKFPKGDRDKANRVALVKSLFPGVELGAKSVAGNVADAILMGVWWLERNPR